MIDPQVSGGESFERERVESLARRYVKANPSTTILEINWERDHWHVRAAARFGDASEGASSSVVSLLRREGLPAQETR